MQFTLRSKIIAVALVAALLPISAATVLTFKFKNVSERIAKDELDELARRNLEQIAKDAYTLCEATNDLLLNKMNNSLRVCEDVIDRTGTPRLDSRETVVWKAKNQFTGEISEIEVPKMNFGKVSIEKNTNLAEKSPIVDETTALVGGTCTIFQLAGEDGDMLRIATNVKTEKNERAVGTMIPAIDPDGEKNEVVATVKRGKPYKGLAYVVNDWYITAYAPLYDNGGNLIGMYYVGDKLGDIVSIRKALESIKVGKSGYLFVLNGSGDSKGEYVISKNGIRDGENILNLTDDNGEKYIETIIDKTKEKNAGEVFFKKYEFQNPGEDEPRPKIAANIYFQNWDWVIGATMYEDDFYGIKRKMAEEIESMQTKQLLIMAGALAVAVALASLIAVRVARPIGEIAGAAESIASGDVKSAREFIVSKSRKIRSDETGKLITSFDAMTKNLDGLIGEVKKAGIRVTTSATEISASAKELESSIAEQAQSAAKASRSGESIAETADILNQRADASAEKLESGAAGAEEGREKLELMKTAMANLKKAAENVARKFDIINQKAQKIVGIVETIDKISDQTNLLSLNAAIEAEKADERGKGFAPVAREISRLAEQTAVAAKDIEYVVEEMRDAVGSGAAEIESFDRGVSQSSNEVAAISERLGVIIADVRELVPEFAALREGMTYQSEEAREIGDMISRLDASAERTKEALGQFRSAAEGLIGAVGSLRSEVSKFQVS